MTFKDADIERVKKDLSGFRSWASDEEVLALLHRLECAEKCLRFHGPYVEGSDIKAWRKSKGLS